MNFKVYKLYFKTLYQIQREIALSPNDIDNFLLDLIWNPTVLTFSLCNLDNLLKDVVYERKA